MRLFDSALFDVGDHVSLIHDGTVIGTVNRIRWRNTPRPKYLIEGIWYKEEHLKLIEL
jgi:hypothetical protein